MQSPVITCLDHLVLTVVDIDQTIAFYRDMLSMRAKRFQVADGSVRWALYFGPQKINLHPADAPFDPIAKRPLPGSADLCFLSDTALEQWISHFVDYDIPIEEGPVARSGATGPITSLYIRDPDGNLIEISNLS